MNKDKYEKKFDFRQAYSNMKEAHDLINDLCFDEKRGFWGTEDELAITTAEADLASAMEQLDFLRVSRGWNK